MTNSSKVYDTGGHPQIVIFHFLVYNNNNNNSVALVHELYRPSDRRLSAKLVPTFANKGCRVVSDTDNYGRRPEPLPFLPSSSSIVLTRLSRPRIRPTTSQEIW
jgi:hypothetical protein